MSNKFNIILPTDFSSGAKNAISTLNLLLKHYDAKVSLMHVIESHWGNFLSSGLVRKEAEQRLRQWGNNMLRMPLSHKLITEVGNPSDKILHAANKTRANLILIGGKSKGSSGRYKSGAVVESVARHAKQSVWICQKPRLKRILCGIDGSTSSAKALSFAIELARNFSAQLTIINAIPAYMPAFGMSKRKIASEEEKLRDKNNKMISAFLDDFDFDNIDYGIACQWGIPSNIILDASEDYNSDLIVVGEKGHNIFHQVLIGTTAEKILRHATSSVLIVR